MLDTIEDAIDAIRNGEMILLVDDEDRENEGDLVIAAEHCTPESINFMATHGRGLICLCLTEERIAELELEPMVRDNTSRFETNFHTPIGAVHGTTTGISAFDRARTVQVAVHPDTKPSDLYRPGHVFPLAARPGGVLERPGHTEGSTELARLAGLRPAAVICEVMSADGTMARLPELRDMAGQHHMKLTSIAMLAEYLREQEAAAAATGENQS